jgi:serine/threonine protein kinase
VLRPGDVLGHHYLLAEQIGQGGFGTVWRARDRRKDEDVAIKVLHPNLAGDPERRQRFFRGARIMAELAHPAVVRIRQLEAEDDGFHYFVMDYLPGGNLHDAVLAGRLKPEQIQPLILHVGAALAAAHERGIVHRDVKPSNILLDDEVHPYLTDFDLVTAPDTTGGTRTGAMGTFLYAPPEMLERPQEADARADVYGLGMTMAFMFNGKPLPHDSVRDASRFVQTLACAAQWQRVLARAVSWEPEHRFADAGEFCQAVHAATETMLPIDAVSESSGNTLLKLLDEIRRGNAIDYPILVRYREPGLGEASETFEPKTFSMEVGRRRLLLEQSTSEIFLLKPRAPAPGGKYSVAIGRGRDCDVRLPGSSVSRMHAEVRFDRDSGNYHIVDYGSRHGTYLNGDLITPGESMPLSSWSIVSIREVAYWFIEPTTLNRLARGDL